MGGAWRRAAWAGGVLAALAAAYLAIGGVLTARVLTRVLTVPPASALLAGAPPTDPFALGYRGDPKAAFGYDFQTVDIPGELGPAPAWLVPGAGGAKGEVWAVYVHGIAGLRENGYRHLSVLHAAGLPTLLISYRNDPGAPASPSGEYQFGLSEWRDLDAAVAYAEANGAERIVLVAESMGGGIAGQFLARSPRAAKVSALVLDAPALDFPAVVESLLSARGLPFSGTLARGGMWLRTARGGFDGNDAVTLPIIRDFRGPLFVAHGGGDTIVPVSISDRLATQRHGATTYLRSQADHLASWQEDPALYRAQLRAFLALAVTSPSPARAGLLDGAPSPSQEAHK
ncbi:MAG: alpha/beta hydrolase [Phenylobacterium sp.]|nr:alpha/beta hydrolase [Phenylobacterium sp.]